MVRSEHPRPRSREADYGALGPALRGVINLDLIVEQWDQLVRIVASHL